MYERLFPLQTANGSNLISYLDPALVISTFATETARA
jgi:hypothetical protein